MSNLQGVAIVMLLAAIYVRRIDRESSPPNVPSLLLFASGILLYALSIGGN